MKNNQGRLIAICASIVVIVLAASLYVDKTTTNYPGSCQTIIGANRTIAQAGYSYYCGTNQASDNKLAITYHGYRFAQAANLIFAYGPGQQKVLPGEVFLLVNVTIANVGGGNTSIAGGWTSSVENGSSPVSTTDFLVNTSFPNTYPNQTIPDVNGGLYLPPGDSVNL